MKVIICGSIHFTYKIKEIADKLQGFGHETEIPLTSAKIINNEMTLEEFKNEKEKNGDGSFRKIEDDVIKRYYNLIKESDAILVVNITKDAKENYIGGNTFLEIGFAHVLEKKIYLLNEIPEVGYKDEILATSPIILNNDFKIFSSPVGE